MKRLTGYNSFGGVYGIGMGAGDNTQIINSILKRLAAYEDAESEGRLVVLPCKVGDTVWFAHEQEGITETSVSEVSYFENVDFISASVRTNYGDILSLRNAGKTWFLTREEAEEALRRTTNEQA